MRGLRGFRSATIILLLAALLTGCWDLREMNQLALVMAVGIDKAPDPGRYQVTIQVARPGSMGRGKGGGGGGAANEPVYTATADGDTIFAAIRNLAQFTSRRIMWAHNNVVVIGEELAREDVTPVMDFFTRSPELRMRTWTLITRGTTAKEIVSAKTGMEEIPADSISALFRYAALPGESVTTDIGGVLSDFLSPDHNPAFPAMTLVERAIPLSDRALEHGGTMQAQLRGTAVFHQQRLVGFLDSDAGRGLLWIRGEMKNAVITIACPKGNRNMAVEIRSPAVSQHANIRGRVPVMTLNIRTEAILAEQDCATPNMEAMALKKYARTALTRKIEKEVRDALAAVQEEFSTDVVGYGRQVHIDLPAWWRSNRTSWDEIFPKVRTVTEISVTIPKMGLFVRPFPGPVR